MPEGRWRAVPATQGETSHEGPLERAREASKDVGRPIKKKTAGGVAGPSSIGDVHEMQGPGIQGPSDEPATQRTQVERVPQRRGGLSRKQLVEMAQRQREGRANVPSVGPGDQPPRVQAPALAHQTQIDHPLERWAKKV